MYAGAVSAAFLPRSYLAAVLDSDLPTLRTG